jgi:hypothetical protein
VVPRLLAGVIMVPLLTVVDIFVPGPYVHADFLASRLVYPKQSVWRFLIGLATHHTQGTVCDSPISFEYQLEAVRKFSLPLISNNRLIQQIQPHPPLLNTH